MEKIFFSRSSPMVGRVFVVFALLFNPIVAEAAGSDFFSPTDYGAVGDGSSHTVQAVLGVTTLGGLAAYTNAAGAHPYSFINSYPYGVLFNLNPHAAASGGATTISFQSTAVVGVKLPVTAPVASGATAATLTDLYATSDKTAVASGTPVANAALPAGATVSGTPTGVAGNWTVTFSAATTATIASGAYLNFSVRPASGSYSLPLVSMTGIAQGDLVTGTCITSGTQVDWVNYARMEIVLSQPTSCQVSAAETLTFVPSWLSKVASGMTVTGPTGAIKPGTTVMGTPSAGVVTLSQSLNTAPAIPITPDQDFLNNTNPTTATPITFWRVYSDPEAANLQMDRLGIQAAVNAASGLGGSVSFPVSSRYLADGPIILPLFAGYSADQPAVSLGGRSPSQDGGGSVIYATQDFGPENALISCGDPTAKLTNARGLYQGSGYFCFGTIHDVVLKTNLFVNPLLNGLRPTWSSIPVAMNGLKQGPRLNWDGISIENFNVGAQSVMDHTQLRNSVLIGNFIGFRADDSQVNLFGDWSFDRLYTSSNTFAGMSFSAKNYWNGVSVKSYIANNPYGIYCEPSFSVTACMGGVTLINNNSEGAGCSVIKDGGIRDGLTIHQF